MNPEKNKFSRHKKNPDHRWIKHLKKVDEKIESIMQEFIDWLEEEKKKVY